MYFIRNRIALTVSRGWHLYFDPVEPCPYEFSVEEIRSNNKELQLHGLHRELWKKLSGIITDEGYSSNETVGEAIKELRKLTRKENLRKSGLAVLTEERIEYDKKIRWGLDAEKRMLPAGEAVTLTPNTT